MAPPVFVLGTGRCGSSLVHEVLARHEDTGFVTNLDDLGLRLSSKAQNDLWRRLPPAVTRKGGARFAPSEGYRVLSKEVGPLVVDPFRELTSEDATPWMQREMRTFVQRRMTRLDAPVFLHKLTGWPRAGFLLACFPDARFVEVYRDGRAVANSWLQMPWWQGHRGPTQWHFGPLPPDLDAVWREHHQSFPVLAAIAWQLLMEAYDEARVLSAGRWLRIRYEDLVAEPRACFETVLAHMGLDWSGRFESGFARYTFAPDRTEAFRRDLAASDLLAVERVIGDTLLQYGYDV